MCVYHCTDEELGVDDNHFHEDKFPLCSMLILQCIHICRGVPASRQTVGRRMSRLGGTSSHAFSEILRGRSLGVLNGAHQPRLPWLCRRIRLRGGRRAGQRRLRRVETVPRTPPGTSPRQSPSFRPLLASVVQRQRKLIWHHAELRPL